MFIQLFESSFIELMFDWLDKLLKLFFIVTLSKVKTQMLSFI